MIFTNLFFLFLIHIIIFKHLTQPEAHEDHQVGEIGEEHR
jgi:hypothetical protein